MKNLKINLKKSLEMEHIYVLKTSNYRSDEINNDGDSPYVGEARLMISKKDYEALKNAGVPCKEYTVAVLAASSFDCDGPSHTVRQLLMQHEAEVDVVKHTNF